MQSTAKLFSDILKFNPYHGKDGRFTFANTATSFTYSPGKSKAHDNAIAREKERVAALAQAEPKQQPKKKKTYSDYIKDAKQKDRDFFYGKGNTKQVSNKYFEFKHVLDDDNCIVVTNNIKHIKGNPVLVTGKNQAVYLKDWQYREVRNWDNGIEAYAVKLNRNYYKPYTFKFDFDGFSFDKNNTFDDMMSTAKAQDRENMKFAEGHTKFSKSFGELIEKFNPYHDAKGRFASAGSASSFTYKPGASTAHSKAIEREKEKATDETKGFKGTLYHGSPNKDIKEFDMSRAGRNTSSGEKLLFFTDSKQMADDFSYERLDGSSKYMQRRGEKGRVYEVDVEMKNPLDFRNLSDKDIDNILKLDGEGLLTRSDIQRYADGNHQLLKAGLTLTSDSLKSLGYDGLIANTGKAGHNSLEYAVVDSKQAKIRKGYDMQDIEKNLGFPPTQFDIQKADEDKRLVFGWALVSATSDGEKIIDHQGDIVEQDELESGAYDYVLNFRDAGEEHNAGLRKKARMVESVVFTAEKLKAMGIPEGTIPYGWWIGFYVDDDNTWELIKNGTYKMFSIEGRAIREPVMKEVAKSDSETVAKTFGELVEKFNPYHDRLGRFTSAGSAASFTYSPGKSKAHDNAIAREKERKTNSGTKAIEIEGPDGRKLSYRVTDSGVITDLGMHGKKDTNGMTLDQLQSRAKELGWKVTTYDDEQLNAYDEQRRKDREKTARQLAYQDTKDRTNTYQAPKSWWKGH